MTYRKLLETLQSIPDEQLDDDVTVWCSASNEYFAIIAHHTTVEADILDENHFYLEIDA